MILTDALDEHTIPIRSCSFNFRGYKKLKQEFSILVEEDYMWTWAEPASTLAHYVPPHAAWKRACNMLKLPYKAESLQESCDWQALHTLYTNFNLRNKMQPMV